jgi:hypothetical protein
METLSIGDHVIYGDEFGVEHDAIVTNVFGTDPWSACNVVYASGDESKSDPYGRQIERATSVVHRSVQPAHGRYWRFDEKG